MHNTYFDRLFLNILIWLIAVVINALLLSLYMIDFGRYLDEFGNFFGACAIMGGIISFPIMIALQFNLRSCIKENMTGGWLFLTVLIVGVVLAGILGFLTSYLLELDGIKVTVFTGSAILSGGASISLQYRSLIKYGSDFTTAPKA